MDEVDVILSKREKQVSKGMLKEKEPLNAKTVCVAESSDLVILKSNNSELYNQPEYNFYKSGHEL